MLERPKVAKKLPSNLCKNLIINMRKAGRFLSKQGHLQPHFHSKARQLSKKLSNGPLEKKGLLHFLNWAYQRQTLEIRKYPHAFKRKEIHRLLKKKAVIFVLLSKSGFQ